MIIPRIAAKAVIADKLQVTALFVLLIVRRQQLMAAVADASGESNALRPAIFPHSRCLSVWRAAAAGKSAMAG
ncbi:hypothetical protein HUU39_13325 [candidate division KSB1 bacterium]|nr:hypothetical protein [bacterium]NUM66244.1 hypothetical protein [candidate division KSB1 bacterium]